MKRSTRAALGALPVIAGLALTATPAAQAATTPAATRAPSVSVSAALPNTLTVAGHRGQPVTVWTKGTAPITMRPLDSAPIRFGGLRTGRAYHVYVGAERATTARTMTAAGRITQATASRGAQPGTLDVRWRHLAPSAVDPATVRFLVTAASGTAPTVRRIATGTTATTITGLQPAARYRVTVTPYLERMRGTGAVASYVKARPAAVTTTLAAPAPVAEPAPIAQPNPAPAATPAPVVQPDTAPPAPTAPAPRPAAAPAPSAPVTPVAPVVPRDEQQPAPVAQPDPAPVPAPAPRTQLVCPDGWTDNGANCIQTSPYTYSTLSYTYSTGVIGQQSIGECWIRNQATGQIERFADCREPIYGNVKDPTPAGYEDTGTEWRRKDAPPAGWTDNGTAYERTTAKIEVPA